MNILICDDDKLYIDMIRKYVDEFFADHKITDYKVYEYNSGDEAAKNNEKIDIAFLDVEMDGINGIEAGKCLRNNNKNIVLFIITSYMGYLDDAMDEGVFRYINKPLERPVIMRGLHKALLLCSKSQSKKINIEYKGDNVIIEQDSIICIESLVRKRYIKTDTQSYSAEIWKRFRKWGGVPTGATQNVKDLLSSPEIENILENSDFITLLNQASGDRKILSERLNLSADQQKYIDNSEPGEGLLIFENVVLPFSNPIPNNTQLYKIMTTRLSEVVEL